MQEQSNDEIYAPEFVEHLFNRMSKTYGITNYLSSFGFTEKWRRQCVQAINWTEQLKFGYDLMSGMGECWGLIMKQTRERGQLQALDFSPQMNQKASTHLVLHPKWKIDILEEDVLKNSIRDQSADFVISSFGLKTFSSTQLECLAKELARILKPGGQFSFIEISRPKGILIQAFYLFYLKKVIPIIGALFMGNSLDYRMLGQYCERFGDCSLFAAFLAQQGLEVELKNYFYGCATGVVGHKPD